eukprot:scaffold162216_cov15-Tisochrysis_lutea.AAC.1
MDVVDAGVTGDAHHQEHAQDAEVEGTTVAQPTDVVDVGATGEAVLGAGTTTRMRMGAAPCTGTAGGAAQGS